MANPNVNQFNYARMGLANPPVPPEQLANANPNNMKVAREREERAYRILRTGLTQVNNLDQSLVDTIASAIRTEYKDTRYEQAQEISTQVFKNTLRHILEENKVIPPIIGMFNDNMYSDILVLVINYIGQKNGELAFPPGVGGRRRTKSRRGTTRTKKAKKTKTKKTKSVRSKKQRTQ